MPSTRPLIAVTGVPITAGGVLGWRQGATAAPAAYLQALDRAGADGAVLMPVALDEAQAAQRLSRFEGLMVVGGGDVDPARYGADPHPEVTHVNPARDGFEIPLLRAAVEGGVPTLAICRGIQVLNVALGGTLHQHISDWGHLAAHRSPDGSDSALHDVRIEPGTRLRKALGADRTETFSHHHQAVDRLGEGLVPVAWADDGLLEAVEHEDGWVVGIQWHAEATAAADPVQQALFDAFVGEARGR
ncbi:MAG: gamma-glutamyl-gamma-aminobutyrate hydrolase family protein [Actinomycetota bacterium]|nr:gamma-glutamyl-gamma-aminobutyrate hydrolase family protein [Actinomycetota bacterium]